MSMSALEVDSVAEASGAAGADSVEGSDTPTDATSPSPRRGRAEEIDESPVTAVAAAAGDRTPPFEFVSPFTTKLASPTPLRLASPTSFRFPSPFTFPFPSTFPFIPFVSEETVDGSVGRRPLDMAGIAIKSCAFFLLFFRCSSRV